MLGSFPYGCTVPHNEEQKFHTIWSFNMISYYDRNEVHRCFSYIFQTVLGRSFPFFHVRFYSNTNRDVHVFLTPPRSQCCFFSLLADCFSRGWVPRSLRVPECNRPLCLRPQTELEWVTRHEPPHRQLRIGIIRPNESDVIMELWETQFCSLSSVQVKF